MRVKKPIHYIALCVGGLAAFVEGLSNVDHIQKAVGTLYDPGVFAAAVTSLGAAVLLAFSIKAFNQRHFIVGLGLVATLIVTAAYTMSTTLVRTSEVRHNSLVKAYKADMQWQTLAENVKALSNRANSECSLGAGPKCEANRSAMYLAMTKLQSREIELDSMGNQVKFMLGLSGVNVSVDVAGRIQPMFLPLALFLLGMIAIAFGENGEWVEPEFKTDLQGAKAEVAKAKRFIEAYKSSNGIVPSPSDIAKVVNISEFRARAILKKVS
jgi:hypothetical protein